MKLVIPYVEGQLAPETRQLGEHLSAEFVDLTGDEFGYWRLFKRLWAEGQSFINVEQDILPTVERLEGIWACPEEWCVCSYPYTMPGSRSLSYISGLGCVKFSGHLLRATEGLYLDGGALANPVRWTEDRKIDNRLVDNHDWLTLTGCEYLPHRHGRVRHLRVEAELGSTPPQSPPGIHRRGARGR